MDVRQEAVDAVNVGLAPISEPGLADILKGVVTAGRFRATLSMEEGAEGAEVLLLAVGTPTRDGNIDLAYVRQASETIGKLLGSGSAYRVVAVKSTVIPGTTDGLVRRTLETASGFEVGRFGLCMNPEFLREGSAVEDFMNPDRIVIGQWDERSGDTLAGLYAPFVCPILRTGLRNAEMIKYTANALLASLISFSNQIAMICESVEGVDVEDVLAGVHLDRRLSPILAGERIQPGILAYLKAGAGYGGSCFPKDMLALTRFGRGLGVPVPLLEAVLAINGARAIHLVDVVENELGDLAGRKVAMLGLTFKPFTDDLRESPALACIAEFHKRGAKVKAYDPEVPPTRKDPRLPEGLVLCSLAQEALQDSEVAVLVTAWPEFSDLDWPSLCEDVPVRVVIDGRNALRSVRWPPGTRYRPIGRFAGEGREVS